MTPKADATHAHAAPIRPAVAGRVRSPSRRGWLGGVALGLAALSASCQGGGTDPQPAARIQVLLTDHPLEAIEAAEVKISRVYLTGGGQGTVDLFHDPEHPHEMNLLDLQNGVTLDLTGEVPVPEGSYGQLRFVVDEARIRLADGYTFADGSSERPLTVPSGFFRVLLAGETDEEDDSGSIVLVGGETQVLLVDFDVEASFVFQGPPSLPTGVLFRPVLRQVGTAP